MSRQYNFKLPYEIGRFYVSMGLSNLKSSGLFNRLPVKLQQRFQYAADHWEGLTITKKDCDSIDPVTWGAIASRLGLSWQTV